MARHGIEVIVPPAQQRDFVHRVIYEELCRGVIDEGSRAGYQEVIAGLVESGAEGVILGCTEIELLTTAAAAGTEVGAATSAVTPLMDHCVIAVSDWDRSNAFYRVVFGAEVVQNPDARWAYRFGAEQLNVLYVRDPDGSLLEFISYEASA